MRAPRSVLPAAYAAASIAVSLAVALAFALAALLVPRVALADSPFDGKWVQGPLKEEYTVQKWQSECGPAPVSGSSGGGESVSVHEEGDELSFVGAGRVFRTNQCYDQLPTLARETHSRNPSGREWRTRCTTPPSDPRRAVINTLMAATSDSHFQMVETGRYEITVDQGLCTADIKRSRTFDAVAKDAPAASAAPVPAPVPKALPSPSPPQATESNSGRCNAPGDPIRLEARPSRKLLRTGETFTFHAVVLDAAGCATHTATNWSLGDRPGMANAAGVVAVDPSGTVSVSKDAPEGSFDLVVSAAGKSAHVTVDVASPSRYDALLQQSGLNAAGENDAASVAVIATGQIGGGDASADDGARRRKAVFMAIIGLLVLVLAVVAVVAMRRTKRAALLELEAQERHAERVAAAEARRREKTQQYESAMRAHEESVEHARIAASQAPGALSAGQVARVICPACRREYDSGSGFCPHDANRLVPINGPGEALAVPGPSGSICPTCKRGYDPGIKVCSHDKDELIPYALYASRQPAAPGAPAVRGKICPTCGGRFQGVAEFCGKDGTALVLLN